MLLCSYFIELSTTSSTFNSIINLLLNWHTLLVCSLILCFQSSSKHLTLFFPFRNFLRVRFMSLKNKSTFCSNFFCLIINKINFERFSFSLEDFLTYFYVFLKGRDFEFTPTTFRTLFKKYIFLILRKLIEWL